MLAVGLGLVLRWYGVGLLARTAAPATAAAAAAALQVLCFLY